MVRFFTLAQNVIAYNVLANVCWFVTDVKAAFLAILYPARTGITRLVGGCKLFFHQFSNLISSFFRICPVMTMLKYQVVNIVFYGCHYNLQRKVYYHQRLTNVRRVYRLGKQVQARV
jgi:hypothetical protein